MPFILQDSGSSTGGGGQAIATALTSATSATSAAWGSYQQVSMTAAAQTLNLPTITTEDFSPSVKPLTISNVGTERFTVTLTGGAITSPIGLEMNPGAIWTFTPTALGVAYVSETNASQASPANIIEIQRTYSLAGAQNTGQAAAPTYATATLVILGNGVINQNLGYTITGNRINIPFAGRYRIRFEANINDNGGNATRYTLFAGSNNTELRRVEGSIGTGLASTIILTVTANLAAGANIDCKMMAIDAAENGVLAGFSIAVERIATTPVVSNNQPVIRIFNTSATYIPTAGMTYCFIEAIGGGGAGAGTTAPGATSSAGVGGGGGAGGYVKVMCTAAQIGASKALTVGTGGPGLSGGGGSNGVPSTVAGILSAGGGATGQAIGAAGNFEQCTANGGLGGVNSVTAANATEIFNIRGGNGGTGYANRGTAGAAASSGAGGNSFLGGGGAPSQTASPIAGATSVSNGGNGLANSGGGGAGGFSLGAGGAASTGGSGGSGKIVIVEHFN